MRISAVFVGEAWGSRMEKFAWEVLVHKRTVTLDAVARNIESTQFGSLDLFNRMRVRTFFTLKANIRYIIMSNQTKSMAFIVFFLLKHFLNAFLLNILTVVNPELPDELLKI